MPEKVTDKFANVAILTATESAANTLTFRKLETGISITDKVAWIINRIEYYPPAVLTALFNASGDFVEYGMSIWNGFTAPALSEPTIIDYNSILRTDLGAAASGLIDVTPKVKDFSQLPGGGVIVPPVPLFAWIKGSGLASASAVSLKIHYLIRQLTIDEYWELVEARRVIGGV